MYHICICILDLTLLLYIPAAPPSCIGLSDCRTQTSGWRAAIHTVSCIVQACNQRPALMEGTKAMLWYHGIVMRLSDAGWWMWRSSTGIYHVRKRELEGRRPTMHGNEYPPPPPRLPTPQQHPNHVGNLTMHMCVSRCAAAAACVAPA